MSKRAFSLAEVLVGAVILAAVFAGLLASFVASRTYIKRANKRLVAANLIRNIFNDLYRGVSQDSWGFGSLRVGTHNLTSYTIDGLTYGGGNNYVVVDCSTVGNCSTTGSYRQVTTTVNYPTD